VPMGMPGCGKSPAGRALPTMCDMTFLDGNVLHPQADIGKTAIGRPPDDADRKPRARRIEDTPAQTPGPVVVDRSALGRADRDVVRDRVPEPVPFPHLDAVPRVNGRAGRFLPPSPFDGQFDIPDGLAAGESNTRIDIARAFGAGIGQTESHVGETRA